MKPQSAKSKGRRHQQRICRDLVEAFAELSADDVRSTSMGAGGEDVLLSPLAQTLIPYSFEAKCCERLNVWSAVEQATKNCPPSRVPCVVIGKNRTDPYAVIPWSRFVELISAPRGVRGPETEEEEDRRGLVDLRRRLVDALSCVDAVLTDGPSRDAP